MKLTQRVHLPLSIALTTSTALAVLGAVPGGSVVKAQEEPLEMPSMGELSPVPENQWQPTVANPEEKALEMLSIGELSPLSQNELESSPLGQITSVDELSDVSPSDWAYQAVVSIVERYGCMSGYDDGTFRGNRAVTRYEFAAALNICLEGIVNRIGDGGDLSDADLAAIQRLQEEFASELAQLRGRVDNIEASVDAIQANQFSTTTKLSGRVEFGLVQAFGDRKAVPSGFEPSEPLDDELILGGTAILTLNTSFTGEDLLTTKLVAGNLPFFGADATGTGMTGLVYGINTSGGIDRDTGSTFILSTVNYTFPVGDRLQVMLAANNSFFDSIIPNYNYADTISLFGTSNIVYFRGVGSGVGFSYKINDQLNFSAAYLVDSGFASSPVSKAGLFDGEYSAMAQVFWQPIEQLGVALSYGHYYAPEPGDSGANLAGFTGSEYAQFPFGFSTATSSDIYSVDVGWNFTPALGIGGWGGYITAEAESDPSEEGFAGSRGDNASMWYWAVGGIVRDLAREGSELVFTVGMPPKVTDNDISSREDDGTTLHLEALYAFPLNSDQSLYITPGIVGILNPEHNDENDDIWLGTLTLSFYF